ncbi:MAG TPA: hypothetical protein VFT69_10340, partial [Pseudolabrys sp.]|nr:hypothetical protein [Pseudolabrys sp.]
PGDAYILRSGGGGGYGPPLDRDLDRLERDVRGGYVSREAAENLYGAAFRADGRIDREASARRRDEMRRKGLPADQPIAETMAPPLHAHEHAYAAEKLTEEERTVLAMSCRCCS